MYDGSLGRWNGVDALAEMYIPISPFVYTLNNPIKYIDPDGMRVAKDSLTKAPENDGSADAGTLEEVTIEAKRPQVQVQSYSIYNYYPFENTLQPGMGVRKTSNGQISFFETPFMHKCNANCSLDHLTNLQLAGWVGEVVLIIGGEWFVMKAGRYVFYSWRAGGALKEAKFIIDAKKFDYFFGRVVTGRAHNISRSAQNLKDLTTMGITSQKQLMKVFADAFANGTKVGTAKISQYGTTVVKSINVGKVGKIEVSFFYKNSIMDTAPRITSMIPKIFK